MKHACMTRRRTARRITRRAALAALLGCAPALAACKGSGGPGAAGTASPTGMPPPAVGSMVPQVTELALDAVQSARGGEGWQTALTSERTGSAKLDILPTRAGPLVCLLPYYYYSENNSYAVLVALDPADGSLAWARLISLPDGAAPWWANYKSDVEDEVRKIAGRSDVVVSPDGRYASVIVRAYVSLTPGEHVSAVAVLDPASGRTVRTEEIRGLVLGQALTDDALVIQTSSLLHPGSETVIAGPDGPDGPGADDVVDTTSTLTAFPLTDPQAPPTTGSTPLWLLGATRDSLLLGASRIDSACYAGDCLGYQVALATASGQTTGRLDGVYAVHPNGFLERFTGGETDDAALTAMARNAPASTANRDKESSWNRVWAGLGRELLDPASGATADITGLTLSHAPTAGGWITICRRPAWSKGDKGPTYAPEMVGWMDAPGPASTEPIMMLSHGGPQKDSSTFTVSLTRTPFTGRTG
ncbi:hypothetical protein [Actinomyces sp. oral taxon 414]|uniref:hypothetical protein n=1 Tax=Actinomyces sp. oral taxon 414 TaxID=712122 RepID=UPI000A46B80E|nr:hypothetical protein [Actinomyces sp. oral taxon 414]